jgi:hypothetical protein
MAPTQWDIKMNSIVLKALLKKSLRRRKSYLVVRTVVINLLWGLCPRNKILGRYSPRVGTNVRQYIYTKDHTKNWTNLTICIMK